MPSQNAVYIQGHLGRDAETKFTGNGTSMTRFSVATSRKWKQNDEWKEETTWIPCLAWKLHEGIAASLKKGVGVIVTGRLSVRSYEVEGSKRTATEVVADTVWPLEKLDLKRATETRAPSPGGFVADSSDVPF